jgi:hypothetical protein
MNLGVTAMRCVVLVLTCISVTISAKAVSIDNFRIRHQIANWVEDNESFKMFTTKTLYEIIDGGATEYIDNGMKRGFFQRLRNSDSAIIELFAEDFGSAEKARKMFNVKHAFFSGMQSAGNADSSSYNMNEIVGGFWAYGVVGPKYFELTLTGINDKTEARKEMDRFFDYYKKTGKPVK